MDQVKILLRNTQSPGDGVMVTAFLRDIHKTYPGKYLTCGDLRGYMGIVQNNPYHTRISPTSADMIVEIGYDSRDLRKQGHRGLHWIQLAAERFNNKTELEVETTECRGEIYLHESENRPLIDPPYWLIFAGGKYDQDTKWWPSENYQTVVDKTPHINWIQCGHMNHWHPPLNNVTNMVGKTKMRELFRLIKFADGIVCPITLPVHVSGALPREGKPRPVVVIGGGKELPHVIHYPGNIHLSTIGEMSCCEKTACWCHLVGGDPKEKSTCKTPSNGFAECMRRITPQRVIEAVLTSQKS